MRYIKVDKIGVVQEFVAEEYFLEAAHGDVSEWELVSNAECKQRCDAGQSLIEAEADRKKSERDAKRLADKPRRDAKKAEEVALKAEYEEFKAWKAVKESK